MTAGAITPGRRREPADFLDLEPGDYTVRKGVAWVCLPDGRTGAARLLNGWTLTEHDDGTITMSPSILDRDPDGDGWHGYLERGQWREV